MSETATGLGLSSFGSADAGPEPAGWVGKLLRSLSPKAAAGAHPSSPLVLLMAVSLIDQTDLAVQGVIGPEIKDYYGIDLKTIGILTSVSGVVGLLAAMPVGFLVDRVDRTKMSAIGAVVLGVFCALTGFAPTLLFYAFARFGAGLGRTLDAAHYSLLSDFYPPANRPAVFSFQALAARVARIIGPIAVGFLAARVFWQLPFFLLAVPALVLGVVMWIRLPEPVRGAHERRLMGATEEEALRPERPVSVGEALRTAWSVRTLRRTYFALPFLVGSTLSITQLLGFYYEERFNLGPGARGVLLALNEPAAILGLLVGGRVSTRMLRQNPGRVVSYGGVMAFLSGFGFLLAAFSPYLAVAVIFFLITGFAGAILGPATQSIISLVTPARTRGIGLSIAVVFILPGVLLQGFALGLGDSFGIQAAILFMVPVYWIGALILTTAGGGVEADIRAAIAAAMAGEISRRAQAEGNAKLLVVKDLDLHYGSVQILFNVDFEVHDGEIVALLGTNGAGKSSLLRAISGLTAPSNGAIFFDGSDVTYVPPAEHAALGIIFMPGGKGVFPGLTVQENLRLAAWLYRKDDAYVASATEQVLASFPRLRERYDQPAGNLSGGEQQMLALGQAFLSKPRLLMIDELSLGLAPSIVEQLLEIVRAIAANGTTIILVEQSVNVALTVAKRAVFMEKGEVRFSGSTADLLNRPDILRSVYLKGAGASGGSMAPSYKRRARKEDAPEVILELQGITKRFRGVNAINGVSFAVPDGQTLGLIGPNGAGKTTIFDIISGFVTPDEGAVLFQGEDITRLGPDVRAKLGLQRSFQDAKLFPALTVAENIAVALERHLESRSTLIAAAGLPSARKAEAKARKKVDRLIDLLAIGDFRDKFVRELSTGSRRLVDLACCVAAEPTLLLLDEPSSGIAQKESEELGPLLQRIRWEIGCTILIIEHDMPLLMGVADELLALELGAPVTRGKPAEVVEHPRVVASYLGTSEEVINRSGNETAVSLSV